jgi:hypothetical protein
MPTSVVSTFGGGLNVSDAGSFQILNLSDSTKVARFSAAGISAGQTRTYTLPDGSDTLVGLALTQSLSGKTFDKLLFAQGTITTDIKGLAGTVTWNEGSTQFFATKVDVTSTASASTSRLLSYTVGGSEMFGVRKDGCVFIGDGNHYLILQSGDPLWGLDSNDYMGYTRSSNTLSVTLNGTPRWAVDQTSTATQTALSVYDVDNGALERVTVGAADSGGLGFKVLRIPN